MFVRTVNLRLKPNSVTELTQTVDKEIIPLLRKQKGLPGRNYLCRSGRNGSGSHEFLGSERECGSLWPRSYPEVLRALAKVVEGTPQVQTSEVFNSTFHKIPAHATN